MVEIEDHKLARHVINQAREYGVYEDINDVATEGTHGQYAYDTEWSIADLDPSHCNVEVNGDTLIVMGTVEAQYTVQTAKARRNPPGKAHPAEYEKRTAPLEVSIGMELGELPEPVVTAEIA
jgi:hypothetical protein